MDDRPLGTTSAGGSLCAVDGPMALLPLDGRLSTVVVVDVEGVAIAEIIGLLLLLLLLLLLALILSLAAMGMICVFVTALLLMSLSGPM